MDNFLYDILNIIDEGIIVLNNKLEICLWNNYMKNITGIGSKEIINSVVYEVLPGLNKPYFIKSVESVMKSGYKMFFSAAMHEKVIDSESKFNIKISRFEKDNSIFLILEFVDVTAQFTRINQLKGYVSDLYKLNKKLTKQEKVIKKLAYYDNLTGIANRILFYETAEKILKTAKKNNIKAVLLFIDIDKFKDINDNYGHEAGDKVLVEIAKTLKKSVKDSDVVARFGGDEFLILASCDGNSIEYKNILSEATDKKIKPIYYKGNEINVSFSIGVSVYPEDASDIDQLIYKADKAMYSIKRSKGVTNNIHF